MKRYFFIILIIFLVCFAPKAHAAIGFDASSTSAEKNGVTSFTWNHTVTSSQINEILLVNVTIEGTPPNVLGVSYNGTALTKALGFAANGTMDEEIWYLVNPPRGIHTVSTTLSANATHAEGNSASFYNVNQSMPIDTVASSSGSGVQKGTSTLTTTVANDWTYEGALWGATATVTGNSNQTMIYSETNNNFSDAVSLSTTTNMGTYATGFQSNLSTGFVMGMVAFEPSAALNVTGYAWGDKLGWVNFGMQAGGLQVFTTTVVGYAWSQNFGWINLAPSSSGVLNDGHGNLSGYAWAQNAGYINFSGVTIDQQGFFHGIASGSVAGSLVFDTSTGCVYCSVTSSWTSKPIVPLTVTAVNLNTAVGGNNPASITLTPNTTTNVNVNAIITDNSCSLIAAGTTTILLYRSGITSSTCKTAPNNLNCYVATAFTASSTCASGSVNTTTTFPVQYYAQATDASSSFSNQNWMATIIFNDQSASTSTDSTSATTTNSIATLLALNLPTSTINYGSLAANANTGATNQLLNVENAGNASDTVALSGTALSNGGSVNVTSSQHYATSSFTFGGGEQQLSSAATTIDGINIAPVINFPIGGMGWQNTAALPYTSRNHTSVAYNGYLYTIAGCVNSCSVLTSTVLFAPINATGSLGAWTSTQALPYILNLQTSVAYSGYLYAIGGTSIGGTSTVLFAPINATGSLGAWTSTQALPYTDANHTSIVYNGYLYVMGGVSGGSDTSTVLFAPINATGSLGAWTSTQALPYTSRNHTSVAYNGYLYTIAGCVNSCSVLTSTVLFAPINATGSLGAWTSTQALPNKLDTQASVVYNGYLYVIGGNSGSITSTVLFAPINATGSLGAWTSTQALPYTDADQPSAIYNGYLYTIAGLANSLDTSTVTFTPLNARSTYWGLSAGNIAAGSYTGTVTFTASFSP